MNSVTRKMLLSVISVLSIISMMPSPVEAAAVFFYNAPRNYTRSYYQPSYRQPVNPYYSQYSPYADPRVYADPRTTARNLGQQNSDMNSDYYQQYQNWWEK